MERREIAIKDFYGKGEHIYNEELGWGPDERRDAKSSVSREIFEFEVVRVGWNLSFYYIDNDTFYGIHTEEIPIEVKELPRDRTEPYIGWQCEGDTHDDGKVLYSFDNPEDIWDNVRIDGKTLEEVLERSYIMGLN
ncbi:MAG: hypothetical protein J5693_02825 [Bacteroidales bacterium]|nr:hypothetical protein [Bacteroidales bacterium]